MWNWITRRPAIERTRETHVTREKPARTGTVPASYALLHKYLVTRYADLVVLSFGQIEDLLGFALPEAARTGQAWWTASEPPRAPSPESNAWMLAGRTAKANLAAQTVAFERPAS